MTQDEMKALVAEKAVALIEPDTIVGVGTGSTVNFFIEELAKRKAEIDGAVSSSEESTARLKAHGIPVYDLNAVDSIPIYVDGADETNHLLQLIKGGGGALTREKIIAAVAGKFVCIVDDTKVVRQLGKFPLPVEVLPMARSHVARQLLKLGGDPIYREGFVTDNGNIILDVHNLEILEPIKVEKAINHMTGVVTNGLFTMRSADVCLVGSASGVEELTLDQN